MANLSSSDEDITLALHSNPNPVIKGSADIFPSAILFLRQSSKILISVSAEQVTLQQKVVEFLLPLTFPQHLYLTLENSDHGVSLSWLDPALPTPSQTSNPDDPPFPPPPPPPLTTTTTETPIFQFKGSNTLFAPSSNQIALTLAMQNIPQMNLIVSTVKNQINILSDLTVEPSVLKLPETLPSTIGFLNKIFLPANPPLSRSPSPSGVIDVSLQSPFNLPVMQCDYPEMLHLLTSIADFSFAVSTAPEENVEGADTTAEDVLLMKMNPHEMSMSFRCKDENLVTKVKEEKLSFDLKEKRAAQVILDMSVYMSRFIGVSLKFPRIYLECVRQEMEKDGSFNLRIRVSKMDNSQGGILTRVLPLKRLSKLLNEGFEVNVNVNDTGQLLISHEVLLPKLPSWFYKIARFFVKKTAGGLLKLMRDLVNAALEDVERVLENIRKEKDTQV
mmetsp:Transcript_14467/g.28798  ORF Transcript_14467/g.28798 Transcript_14467/m.28798 type:complete len:446 (-) Transcript_14467:966-2303(-)